VKKVNKWGIPAALGCVCLSVLVLALSTNRGVSVRVVDPRIKINIARVSHWVTNDAQHIEQDRRWLRIVNSKLYPALHKIGLSKSDRPPYISPALEWGSGPTAYAQDQLVLFGTCEGVNVSWLGFCLTDTNGVMVSAGGNSACGLSRRGFLTNTFGTLSGIPTNLHGLFLLKFHGGTNVLAEVRL
jgi:hypothetical protein